MGRSSRVPWPGRNVEDARTFAHVGRIQQRGDGSAGDLTQEVVVRRRLLLPPVRLECMERLGVDGSG